MQATTRLYGTCFMKEGKMVCSLHDNHEQVISARRSLGQDFLPFAVDGGVLGPGEYPEWLRELLVPLSIPPDLSPDLSFRDRLNTINNNSQMFEFLARPFIRFERSEDDVS